MSMVSNHFTLGPRIVITQREISTSSHEGEDGKSIILLNARPVLIMWSPFIVLRTGVLGESVDRLDATSLGLRPRGGRVETVQTVRFVIKYVLYLSSKYKDLIYK